MKKEEIFITDWKRILFGDTPAEFMLEVFIRTLVIYLVLLTIARLLGKRMGGQLTLTETAVMVTLGAIVSPAMQLPDRGIAMGIVALTCALAFQRGVNLWGFESPEFEKISQGTSSAVVKDGLIMLHEMESIRLSKQELFALLRSKQVYNLGKVERAYFEACGLLSVYTLEEEKPGLSLIPPGDEELCKIQQSHQSEKFACNNCGYTLRSQHQPAKCSHCDNANFSPAVLNLTE
ncbi:DUF421 domain-containing protein [Arcticibacter tournemirensis]|uniref:DUF421 domain-containing protein n=1 Tax=Arcticibacter tournemirensis TaxID=699437 RepID=A0A4Q0MCW7_9SPHI|nr:YetF domain-containing protein [Arcticibacter tournemirensis]RXF71228.1 DUF421 domain-containing protein [Arcticibacter tournemirensis]